MELNKYRFFGRIASIIAPFVYNLFGLFATFLINVDRLIAYLYTLIWPYSGTSWFDHRFDFLRGPENIFWLERAFYANNVLKKGDYVLDIGCGDGIFSGLFYSEKAKRVDAIDIDKKAIDNAKKLYSRKNVHFLQKDIINWDLNKKYDKVFLFAVIEHFTPEDGLKTLSKIGRSLTKEGVLVGSTPILNDHKMHNFEHQNEFESTTHLKKFLSARFKKVKIFTSDWPGRLECYFECHTPISTK